MCSFAWGGNRCREGIIPLKKCSSSERGAGGGGGAGAGGGGLLNTSRRHFSICPSLSLPQLSLFSVSSSLFQMETTFLGQITDKNTFNMKGYEYLTVILITYHSRIGTLMTTSTKCSIK
jgi:hypothetical protein